MSSVSSPAIDWPGIRANAVTMGIRPAARAAASGLPPDEAKRFEERVAKRATREGWEEKRLAVVATSAGRQQGPTKALSTNVLHGQDAAINTLADLDKQTRHNLAAFAAEASSHAGSLKGAEALKEARNAKEVGNLASTVHGWDASRPDVRINVFADGMKVAEAIEIESEAIRIDE